MMKNKNILASLFILFAMGCKTCWATEEELHQAQIRAEIHRLQQQMLREEIATKSASDQATHLTALYQQKLRLDEVAFLISQIAVLETTKAEIYSTMLKDIQSTQTCCAALKNTYLKNIQIKLEIEWSQKDSSRSIFGIIGDLIVGRNPPDITTTEPQEIKQFQETTLLILKNYEEIIIGLENQLKVLNSRMSQLL